MRDAVFFLALVPHPHTRRPNTRHHPAPGASVIAAETSGKIRNARNRERRNWVRRNGDTNFLNTTAKFGTNFPDCGTSSSRDRAWWLSCPVGVWLAAVVAWRRLEGRLEGLLFFPGGIRRLVVGHNGNAHAKSAAGDTPRKIGFGPSNTAAQFGVLLLCPTLPFGNAPVPYPPPCVTFRRVVAPLRGPGQSPVLPFACCVGSLLSVGRCGRCSCWCRFRVCGAPSLVCWGCAECGVVCRLRVSGAQ